MLKPTIGLEIHVALQTKHKLFSTSTNNFAIDEFSLFDVGTPGYLPVLNYEPVEMACAFAYSINAEVKKISVFERKHYFYPDLPIGYQITQQHDPIMIGGKVGNVIIEHAHLECDAAKSIHTGSKTYVDISRCASPLLEIVTTPCMKSPSEAKEFAKTVHELVSFLKICDGKLEEGSFRVDASISLSDTDKLGTRVEIKNISSFYFLEKALEYEIERQRELIMSGGKVKMETRSFDEENFETLPMREKESVADYRYTPDPDIPVLVLPDDIENTVRSKYNCNFFDLIDKIKDVNVDHTVKLDVISKHAHLINSFVYSERITKFIFYWLRDLDISRKLSWGDVEFLCNSSLSASEVKDALLMWNSTDKDIKDCLPKTDGNAVELVKNIVAEYPNEMSQRSSSPKIIGFLVGKCMQTLKGKVPPATVKSIIETL